MSAILELMDKPVVLCRGFFLHASSPSEVQIRSGLLGGHVYSLRDPSGSGRLMRFLAALDGRRTVRQVLSDGPAQEDPILIKLVTTLVEKEVLVPVDPDPLAAIQQGLAALKLSAEAKARLHTARVGLSGAGVLGSRIATNLVWAGVRRISLWDPAPLREYDRQFSPAYLKADGEGSRADHLGRFLRGLDHEVKVEVVSHLEQAVADHALAVVAQDSLQPSLCTRVNAFALTHGVTWVTLAIDGHLGLVGPGILPRQTPCYACLEAHVIESSRQPDQLARVLQTLRDETQSGTFSGMPAYADVLSGLFVADIPTLLLGGPAYTLGRMLAINFTNLSATTRAIPRMPRCPACGLHAETPD